MTSNVTASTFTGKKKQQAKYQNLDIALLNVHKLILYNVYAPSPFISPFLSCPSENNLKAILFYHSQRFLFFLLTFSQCLRVVYEYFSLSGFNCTGYFILSMLYMFFQLSFFLEECCFLL